MKPILKLICILFLICLSATQVQGQGLTVKVADLHFRNSNYREAISLYEFALKKNRSNAYIMRQLAEANYQYERIEIAARWLRKMIDQRVAQPDDIFRYAELMRYLGNYPEAIRWEQEFASRKPADPRSRGQFGSMAYIEMLKRDSARYAVEIMKINTVGAEFGPVIFDDQLIFASTRSPRSLIGRSSSHNRMPYLKLFSCPLAKDGTTGKISDFAPHMRTKFHDGPVSIHPSGEELFLNSNQTPKFQLFGGNRSILNLEILIGRKVGGKWQKAEDFPYNSTKYSTGHPAIDPSGTNLYFTSNMPGGYGGADLYVSHYENGQWGQPKNLGPEVNTWGNETFPFVDEDGVLYFTSNGHAGMGGMDIFCTYPINGIFSVVENLGYPVNTSHDDFGLCLDKTGKHGYFASNRKGGKGNDDLYGLRFLHRTPRTEQLALEQKMPAPSQTQAPQTKQAEVHPAQQKSSETLLPLHDNAPAAIPILAETKPAENTNNLVMKEAGPTPVQKFVPAVTPEEKKTLTAATPEIKKTIPAAMPEAAKTKPATIPQAPKTAPATTPESPQTTLATAPEGQKATPATAPEVTKTTLAAIPETTKEPVPAVQPVGQPKPIESKADQPRETSTESPKPVPAIKPEDKAKPVETKPYQAQETYAETPKTATSIQTVNKTKPAEAKPDQLQESYAGNISPTVETCYDDYPEPIMMDVEDGYPLQIIKLEYIYFDLAKWSIRKDAAQTLKRVAGLLKQYPELEVRMESHADARGDARMNMALSEKRGHAAFLYLIAREILSDRMQYKGYGETRLLNICEDGVDCDEIEHASNRRCVIKIVRKGDYEGDRLKRSPFYF